MKNLSVTLDDEDEKKLDRMVESGEAANVSHAVRKCIRAYALTAIKEVPS